MFYIGIDVSKTKLDCSLLLDASNNKRRAKSVINSKSGIADLIAWCAKQQIEIPETHVIMEGTGVYHELAALSLVEAGATVSIVNPAQVKDFGRGLGIRTKTDGIVSSLRRIAAAEALVAAVPRSTYLASLAVKTRSDCPRLAT